MKNISKDRSYLKDHLAKLDESQIINTDIDETLTPLQRLKKQFTQHVTPALEIIREYSEEDAEAEIIDNIDELVKLTDEEVINYVDTLINKFGSPLEDGVITEVEDIEEITPNRFVPAHRSWNHDGYRQRLQQVALKAREIAYRSHKFGLNRVSENIEIISDNETARIQNQSIIHERSQSRASSDFDHVLDVLKEIGEIADDGDDIENEDTDLTRQFTAILDWSPGRLHDALEQVDITTDSFWGLGSDTIANHMTAGRGGGTPEQLAMIRRFISDAAAASKTPSTDDDQALKDNLAVTIGHPVGYNPAKDIQKRWNSVGAKDADDYNTKIEAIRVKKEEEEKRQEEERLKLEKAKEEKEKSGKDPVFSEPVRIPSVEELRNDKELFDDMVDDIGYEGLLYFYDEDDIEDMILYSTPYDDENQSLDIPEPKGDESSDLEKELPNELEELEKPTSPEIEEPVEKEEENMVWEKGNWFKKGKWVPKPPIEISIEQDIEIDPETGETTSTVRLLDDEGHEGTAGEEGSPGPASGDPDVNIGDTTGLGGEGSGGGAPAVRCIFIDPYTGQKIAFVSCQNAHDYAALAGFGKSEIHTQNI